MQSISGRDTKRTEAAAVVRRSACHGNSHLTALTFNFVLAALENQMGTSDEKKPKMRGNKQVVDTPCSSLTPGEELSVELCKVLFHQKPKVEARARMTRMAESALTPGC